jgi:hypothetical protein
MAQCDRGFGERARVFLGTAIAVEASGLETNMSSINVKSVRTPMSLLAIVGANVVSASLSGGLLAGMGIQPPSASPQSSPALALLVFALTCVLGLWPLARLLSGHWLVRGVSLGVFYYVTGPLNNAWEASTFSTIGGTTFLVVYFVLPAAVTGLLMARLVPGAGTDSGPSLRLHRPMGWALRLLAAWLSFPIIYLAFGTMVAPIVVAAYTDGQAALQLPTMNGVVATALGRSATFLLSVIPILLFARAQRLPLALALGWAYTALVGLAGLLSADFLPVLLRAVHAVEIAADSFAYAGVLVLLLLPPAREPVMAQGLKASSGSAGLSRGW